MPVLLEAKDFDAWPDGSLGPEALKPASEEALREWKVSPRLNRTGTGDDDPTIIEPCRRANPVGSFWPVQGHAEGKTSLRCGRLDSERATMRGGNAMRNI